jgi:hypothetical protein
MPTHRVLILGGGFGVIAAAVALRERLDPADEVVLTERRTTFVMGLRKNWAVLDPNALADGERPLALLTERGIRVTRDLRSALRTAVRRPFLPARWVLLRVEHRRVQRSTGPHETIAACSSPESLSDYRGTPEGLVTTVARARRIRAPAPPFR